MPAMASLTLKSIGVLFILTTSLTTHANQCLRFYDEIYFSENMTYGLQSYEAGVKRLKEHFNIASRLKSEEKLKYFMSSDMRVVFFRLQSLSKVYEKAYDDADFFTEKRTFFKKYEDLLGKVDLFEGILKKVKPMKEVRLMQHFEKIKQEAIDKLFAGLKEDGLLSESSKKMDDLLEELVKFPDWKKPQKDLELHAKRLRKSLEKLAEKIKAREFTNDDIELGLHELRRQIRWPLIHIQTLTRLTVYNKEGNLPKKVQALFEEMIAKNPKLLESGFLKMRDSEISEPIQIPFIPHAILTEMVTVIGTKKDNAEADIFVDEAMRYLKFSATDRTRVEAKLKSNSGESEKVDHKALAEEYQRKIEESGILEFYAEQIEKLNLK